VKKICFICKTEKEAACFSKNRTSKDGLASRCQNCNRAQMYAYHQAHPEERKAYGRAYYEKHKEERRVYREANKAKLREYQQEYKAKNREYLAEIERLRKLKIRAKQARAAAKIDSRQLKPEDEPRLFNA